MASSLLLITSNAFKHGEFQLQFNKYNISVHAIPTSSTALETNPLYLAPGCLGYVTEEGSLSNVDFDQWQANQRPVATTFTSTMRFHSKKSGMTKIFTASVRGHLIPRQLSPIERTTSFGFDPYFHPAGWKLASYTQYKLSPRDMVCSALLKELKMCYFADLTSWKLLDVPEKYKNKRCIDFDIDPALVLEHVMPQCKPNIDRWFKRMTTCVLNNGTFFRASANKRHRISWSPGMNSGIPFTPKPKDVQHERTYLQHDICHQMLFDPLFIGDGMDVAGLTIEQESALYVICRLMSEMITLPLGDMLYVDMSLKDNIPYETMMDRKIIGLYRSMFGDIGVQSTKDLRTLLRASYRFGIVGRQDAFGNPDDPAFQEFFAKYASYAAADLLWSQRNATFIRDHVKQYRTWYGKHERLLKELGLQTVSELWVGMKRQYEYFPAETTSDVMFEGLVQRMIRRFFRIGEETPVQLLPWSVRQRRGFQRWAVAQMLWFEFEGQHLPNSDFWESELIHVLNSSQGDHITFRTMYELMLQEAAEINIITTDDVTTYAEIYSLTPPTYVPSYDHKVDNLTSLLQTECNRLPSIINSL